VQQNTASVEFFLTAAAILKDSICALEATAASVILCFRHCWRLAKGKTPLGS